MNEERAATSPQHMQALAHWRDSVRAWMRQWATSDATKTALVAWLALRFYCTLIGAALYAIVPAEHYSTALHALFGKMLPACPQYIAPGSGVNGALAGMWVRWDTPWYLEIASHGYSCYGSSVFMPLYPLLIRMLGILPGSSDLGAALLISSIASFAAFYLLYLLAKELTGSIPIARASVAALALFPVSFFLMAGYTEALFLALAIAAYLAARRRSWIIAGILVALATLTRLQGIVLLVPMSLELLLAPRSDSRRWQPWLTLLIAPLALTAYITFIRDTQGLSFPWEPLSAASGPWHLHYAWPWQGIGNDLGALLAQPDLGLLISFKLLDPLTALLFALCTVAAFRRLPLPLSAFLVTMWLSSVIKVNSDGYTTSISRYMLALFPAFIVLGTLITRWPRLVRLGAAVGAFFLLSMYLFIFLVWGWVA